MMCTPLYNVSINNITEANMGQKKGYKQTPEHIANRIKKGEDHPAWKGENISARGGRGRALKLYPVIGPCILCGSPRSERHHRDGNTRNNQPGNILIICRKCHMKKDGRLDNFSYQARENIVKLQAIAAESKKAKSSCRQGHPYTLDNTYIAPSGARSCRQCQKEASKRYYRRKYK